MRGLYAEVYAEPPYCEGEEYASRFADYFEQDTRRPGFSLAIASEESGLIGAVYGWTMAPGSWFKAPIEEPPSSIFDVPKFAIIEWMVRRSSRGSGVGRHLLDLVLADRSEPFAVLASNPAAPARGIYEKLGWQYCGSTEPNHMPRMDILALPLEK
ncbi:GNAT family N-acetyltransferase [Dactylosporangium sp. CS-047395]|uniref:GNAT family N-acetyltransferase n=1 Tax=Dactylosporangium sp. CS-047395 TaxID=3239936 RepID=UPI003D8DB285